MGVTLSEVPPTWREMLSDYWGATSLHASVFRTPRGLRWVHCNRCRSPSSPSGMRSMVLPAHGRVQMTVVCETTQALLKREVEAGQWE
jgi:hypothetical protein